MKPTWCLVCRMEWNPAHQTAS